MEYAKRFVYTCQQMTSNILILHITTCINRHFIMLSTPRKCSRTQFLKHGSKILLMYFYSSILLRIHYTEGT